jgi:hypothetical protein
MLKRCRWTCTLAVLALIAPSAARASEKLLLAPAHKAGQGCYVQLDQNIQFSQSMVGGSSEMPPMKGQFHRLYGLMRKVESADSKGLKLSFKFDRVNQNFKMGFMSAAFDSDDPENEDASPQLAAPIKEIVGQSIKVHFDDKGKVTSFSGMDAIGEKIEALQANPFAMQIRQEMTDARGKIIWGDSLYVLYPWKKVGVGEKWNRSLTIDLPRIGKITTDYECRLDSIKEEGGRKVAVISFKGTSRSAAKAEQASGENGDEMADDEDDGADEAKEKKNPAPPPAKVKGEVEGKARFDVAQGEIVDRQQTVKMKIELTAPSPAGEGKGPRVKIDQEIVEHYTTHTVADRDKEKAAAAAKIAEAKKKAAEEEGDDEEGEDDDSEEDE